MTGLAVNGSTKWTVHIEVRLQPRATTRFETVRGRVQEWISSFQRINLGTEILGWKDDIPDIASSIERITVSESSCPSPSLPLEAMVLQIHVYQPSESHSFDEFTTTGEDDDTIAASVCELPNRNWEGLWDSLIYADNIKMKMLDYIHATLVLSDANVDFNLISWNRVVLLHGPPGTGKTSLCHALAQKLSIRLSHRYSHARLLEINSHSLFSKWFSESGKLVQRLFTSITELADEEDAFLAVLIDEVESLTAARAGAMAGTEPSDGLRVVNALLTQLDKLKHRKNVLIMATSNLVKAIGMLFFSNATRQLTLFIDSAFVDRADIVQYVDLPSRDAIYEILRTCLCEIVSKGIVSPVTVPTLQQARIYELSSHGQSNDTHEKSRIVALRLLALAAQCRSQSMSGRALRRLPVLALAKYIGIGNVCPPLQYSATNSTNGIVNHSGTDVDLWLDGIERVVKEHAEELAKLI